MSGDAVAALAQRAAVFCINASFSLLLARAILTPLWPSDSGWSVAVGARLRQVTSAATALCGLALLVELWLEGAVMEDASPLSALGSLDVVLAHSRFGELWIASCVLLAAFARIARPSHSSASGEQRVLALALLALFALARSASGHAASAGILSIWVAVDWLHLVATSVWVGSVALAAWVLLSPAALSSTAPGSLKSFIARLSLVASIALVALLVTGCANALHGMDAVDELWSSSYGRILLVKLALVTIALVCAAVNRWLVMPHILGGESEPAAPEVLRAPAHFVALLRVESLALFGALALAAALSASAPPAMAM